MNREFIPSMNPAASVTAWEVSPCLELPDYEGGSEIQAFETFEEAESASDEATGPVFWGVYARLSETAIAAGELPAVHIKDFDTHAKAVAFVRLMNGDEVAASARLMAAAPRLLEALRITELALRYAAQESAGRVRAEIVGGWLHHANEACVAIAEATGNA